MKNQESEPSKNKSVAYHTDVCCRIHGCKFGRNDICVVVNEKLPQSYPCHCEEQ